MRGFGLQMNNWCVQITGCKRCRSPVHVFTTTGSRWCSYLIIWSERSPPWWPLWSPSLPADMNAPYDLASWNTTKLYCPFRFVNAINIFTSGLVGLIAQVKPTSLWRTVPIGHGYFIRAFLSSNYQHRICIYLIVMRCGDLLTIIISPKISVGYYFLVATPPFQPPPPHANACTCHNCVTE